MTKKLLSILLCVTMILTSFVTVGLADDPARISFLKTVTSEGTIVTVPVAVGGTINLDNISAFTATFSYDEKVLEFIGIESGKMEIDGSDDKIVNSGVPGKLSISWLASASEGRPAVTKDAFNSGGAMFSIKFRKDGMATGTTDVTVVEDSESDPQIHPEIGDDNNNFVRLNTDYARATVELSKAIVALGEAEYTDGEIRIPVTLDRVPSDIGFIGSFTMYYSYDRNWLRYVRTDDGVFNADNAEGEYASDNSISFFTKGTGISDVSKPLCTLVFEPVSSTYTGEVDVVLSLCEVGARYMDYFSKDFYLNDTKVDLSKYVSAEKPAINITPVVKEDGVTVEVPVVLTKVPENFDGKLNSFTMEYTYDNTKFVLEKTDSDGEYATDGKISGYSETDIAVPNSDGTPKRIAQLTFKKKSCDVDGELKIDVTNPEIGRKDVGTYNVTEIVSESKSVPSKEHVWGAWTKINETTEEHICSVCGKSETREIVSATLSKIEASVTSIDVPYAIFAAGADAVKEFINGKYTVTATYSDASTETVTADATIDIDAKLVKLSYTEKGVTKDAEITLNVGAPQLKDIMAKNGAEVITTLEIPWNVANDADAIKAYIETQGIEVYGIYEDGSSDKIVPATLTVDSASFKATYTYEGIGVLITLTRPGVVLESIEVNPTELDIPYATVKAGEDAVKEYIKGKYAVTAKYNSGSTLDVTDKATVTVDTASDKIIVSYTENGVNKEATITIKRGAPQLLKITVRQGSIDITEIPYCVTGDLPRLKAFVDGLRLKVYGTYEDDTVNEVADASLDFYNYEKFIWKAGELTAEVAVKYIDHNWEFVSEVAPTQDTDGSKSYRCKLCGEARDVIIPKLSAEVDTITADPTTIDVSYDIWSGANAADKIADIIRNKVKLTAKMIDGSTYTDLINEATITVDTDAKTAKISYGGKDIEITLNFAPDPSAAVESIAVTPTSLTIAYADWYGKTTEQLAAFIKAYNGYKVTATKSDNTTEDVTEDAVITVTMGSNLSGTATVTYEGKTATIALAFTPSSSTGGSGNNRRPGGGGTFNPGGNTTVVPTPTPSDDSIFKDLPKDHFAYDAVMDLYNKGIVSGDGNNYIYPEDGITREEIAKIALTVNQIPEETGLEIDAADKGDVSAWATNIVATAMKKGILVGYGDGTIRPKQVVTREEMVAMFIRALGVQADNKSTNFSDVSAEAWSAAYVAAASDLGFVKGYEDGTFRPANNITRAEAFVICHRIMQFRDTLTAAIAG